MNIYTEKIMKINNQVWSVLKINGTQDDRTVFTSYAENLMLGCEHKQDASIVYFENKDIDKVNMMLNNYKSIDSWEWSEVEEENWIQKCQDFFKPVVVNDKVEIIPYWEESSMSCSIKINPALAFGTGHHETTYMMVQAMLDLDLNKKSVFDIGTGSGILSILAKKLGAQDIFAIDYDDLTYNNFYENLELNDVGNGIEFKIQDCDNINNFNYDFIFANINLNVLLDLIPKINTSGNVLVLSGILSTDKEIILKALGNKKVKKIYKRNEWLCLVIEL